MPVWTDTPTPIACQYVVVLIWYDSSTVPASDCLDIGTGTGDLRLIFFAWGAFWTPVRKGKIVRPPGQSWQYLTCQVDATWPQHYLFLYLEECILNIFVILSAYQFIISICLKCLLMVFFHRGNWKGATFFSFILGLILKEILRRSISWPGRISVA